MYNDGDSERKYLPQFFKFLVANPLSVRTKVPFDLGQQYQFVYSRVSVMIEMMLIMPGSA